mgnify:CR=1 FL=1
MKNILKTIIADFHETRLKAGLRRNLELPVDSGSIISVTGVRRCGKTFLLYETIKRIISGGVPKKNILYINFEDERLIGFDHLDFNTLLEAHFALNQTSPILFLDEVQNID